jgi:hypothetical protein
MPAVHEVIDLFIAVVEFVPIGKFEEGGRKNSAASAAPKSKDGVWKALDPSSPETNAKDFSSSIQVELTAWVGAIRRRFFP